MSIATELTLLANSKQAIKNSINQKGGSITDSTPFADYSTAIDNLPSGGDDSTLRDLIERDITSITIPSGTTSIGEYAFQGCAWLTSVTIPSGVTSIRQHAFQGCTSLSSITIPSGVTTIAVSAFQGCTSLTSITIPSSVTVIGQNAFYSCSLLSSITIPSSVTSIGASAFQYCYSLASVTLNATTPPTIAANVFDNTNNCPIYVPSASVNAYKAAANWSAYASRIFADDSILFTPTNGDPAISVKHYELATANYVQSTDVPATIKNGAGSLEICEGVTRIGMSAFQNGTSLTSVTLPSTLTRMDEVVFDSCTSLTSVTVNATTPPTIYAAVFRNTNNCPIYVPYESVDAYKAANNWSDYASRIQAIPVLMAEITQSDDSVYEIPYDGVGVLDENNVPYENVLEATDIHITSYATAIGQPYEVDGAYYGVFEGDGGSNLLATVTIDEGITAIPNQAFAGNLNLSSVTLPSTITSIGDYAFGHSDGSGPLAPMSFTIHATTPPTLGTYAVGVKNAGRPPYGKFYVPAASVDTYKAAAGWSDWAQFIEAIPSE